MRISNCWRIGFSLACLMSALTTPAVAQGLPFGAEVGVLRQNPKAPVHQVLTLQPGEFSADFSGNGKPYKIIFYTLPANMLGCPTCRSSWFDLVNPDGITMARYGVTWPGRPGFIATARYFEPTGVHQILKGGPPMLVSFAVVGASAGGLLNIFRWDRQTTILEDVSGPWNEIEQVDDVRFEDLDHDGNDEVIIEHHTMNSVKSFGPQSVYRWNGKRFERQEKATGADRRPRRDPTRYHK